MSGRANKRVGPKVINELVAVTLPGWNALSLYTANPIVILLRHICSDAVIDAVLNLNKTKKALSTMASNRSIPRVCFAPIAMELSWQRSFGAFVTL